MNVMNLLETTLYSAICAFGARAPEDAPMNPTQTPFPNAVLLCLMSLSSSGVATQCQATQEDAAQNRHEISDVHRHHCQHAAPS